MSIRFNRQNLEIVLTGIGQQLANGSWAARCLISVRTGNEVTEQNHRVPEEFGTQEEAISAGLHWGRARVEKDYPIE